MFYITASAILYYYYFFKVAHPDTVVLHPIIVWHNVEYPST